MNITIKTRYALIRMGKVLPFIVCFILLISYSECLYSLSIKDYIEFPSGVCLNKAVSWAIGEYFRYDLPTLVFFAIVSFAIRTCIWNKLSIAYLAVQLYEKSFFAAHEYNVSIYYIVTIVNIALCLFFCCKGIKILTTKTSTQ